MPRKNIYFISLGCPKNLVDSECMLGLLSGEGFTIVSEVKEARVAVINTCAFIRPAVEESIDVILELAELKKRGQLARLYVTGCFVQRYGVKLRRELPEVDGWLGTGEFQHIADVLKQEGREAVPFRIGRPLYLAGHDTPRVRTTPFYTAYLKIAEGCSHRCSYCTIPALRGPYRSRSMDSLLIEAEEMAEKGVKELNLIAQDTTFYGYDLEESVTIEDLLEKLLEIEGLQWIRILYSYPTRIADRLLKLIEQEERICPYLDIPLQHVNENILAAMGRSAGRETLRQLIRRVRALSRAISIRTTFMVGFPGETDAAFEELYEFIRTAAFDYLGTFIFCPEKGTPAARLGSVIDDDTAARRRDDIMALQSQISMKRNRMIVGKVLPVLIEGPSPETDLLLKGRTADMA
ncbi:MAG: 30S ribosomal protein S12 methylthiotransferase RimO, partial [Deltaproteobacteria bacterium]|nr:30S ribosomal protein S12 methylthiotransferase RimO [Deltaproteobacteria bacterium]